MNTIGEKYTNLVQSFGLDDEYLRYLKGKDLHGWHFSVVLYGS